MVLFVIALSLHFFAIHTSQPLTESTSTGEGRYSTMASSKSCMPLFLKAEAQRTGIILLSQTALRKATFNSGA